MYEEVLLARQPIYNDKISVVAYELLFRQFGKEGACVVDGDNATSEVLLNVFTQLNINEIVQQKQAYINFTQTLISKPPPFDKKKFVIEVLEDVEITDELVEDLQRLSKQGYTIALDDFIHTPEADRILPFADIVKIDLLALTDCELEAHVKLLQPYDLTLLAEKVETHEVFQRCKDLGFELFQGYFLSKPEIISGRKIPTSKLVVLELLSKLNAPGTNIAELDALISRDPALSFKTLKLVNAACYAPTNKIESLARAITYLGLDTIRSLTSLLALSNLSDKPNALRDYSAIRAKLCELVGKRICPLEAPIYFSVGLLSTLDAYFDQPMADLIQNLSLDERVEKALLHHEGVYGSVLLCVTELQNARFDGIDLDFLAEHNISTEDLNQIHRDTITWYQEAAF